MIFKYFLLFKLLSIIISQTNLTTFQYFPIGTCNVTCGTCTGQQFYNTCLSCQAELTVSNGSCVHNPGSTIYYQEYFMTSQLSTSLTTFTGWQLYSINETKPLTNQNISGCINPSALSYFYFDTVGLFKSRYSMIKTISFPSRIQKLQAYFMVLYFHSPMRISVTFNDQTILSANVSSNSFTNTLNITQVNGVDVITCDMFTYNTASLNYRKFSTPPFQSQTNNIITRFSAQYNSTNQNTELWGIRQIVFIGTKCVSCPSDAIINAASTTGIVIAIILLLLIVLIVPILILQKLYIRQVLDRKRNIKTKIFNQRLGRNRHLFIPRMIYKIMGSQKNLQQTEHD